MALLAKIAMVLSWGYFTLALGLIWIGQILGLHNGVWEIYQLPEQSVSPPMWTMLVGLAVAIGTIASLSVSYWGGWRILNGGPSQDFRSLGRNLRKMAWGLIGFWVGYNLLVGAVQYLLVIDLPKSSELELDWSPFDSDIVFVISGIVLLAISQTLERAWIAEDETKHFL